MENDAFYREFDRSLSKTDLFRILKIAVKRHLCRDFAIIDMERLGATGATLQMSTVLEMVSEPQEDTAEVLSVSEAVLDWLRMNRGFVSIRDDDKAAAELAQYYRAARVSIFPTIGPSGHRHTLIVTANEETPSLADMVFEFTAILFRLTPLLAVDGGKVSLSSREIETIRWIAAGKTSSEMATILGLSKFTINEYVSSAMNKTSAVNRVHLVANAIRRGLIH